MIVFEKNLTNPDGIACFEVTLVDGFLYKFNIISEQKFEKNESNQATLLVDNTGMIHELVNTGNKLKYRAALVTDEHLAKFKKMITTAEYSWSIWCLINPILATNDTVHASMKFTMHPLFEQGTFTGRSPKIAQSTLSIGYFPSIICGVVYGE